MKNGPQPTTLPPTKYSTNNCTSVSIYCPAEFTIYGYYPNLGANAFFCAFFALCLGIQFVFGIRYKTWTYMIALVLGTLAEAIGYVGRIMLHSNPWSSNGFEIQICCLIIAPAFIAAGVYLTLKHITLELGASFSRIRPKFYTWIFCLADLFSLILQGAGGGIAATANHGSSMQQTGNNLMMAGIVWQVFTLLIFGGMVGDYASRVYARRSQLEASAIKLMNATRFKLFTSGLVLAYLTIFTRCVFRIGEMAKGWGNPIMQDQTDFIVLDGVMITIATLCLTAFHPGVVFPEMQMHGKTNPIGEFTTAEAEKVHDGESPPDSERQGYFRAS
ncbi:MAG: hypothetical protein ALECFALPRED_009719 [Alectoria fallacina]|uniref:RTA1-domain-containing protein n=1 Tax=Alectoria fallacina TaxID=1903189 RepID=A0A8H3J7Q3_9LECA|nr:MAG: hypothetical protein ALECFALPRED_009719 [Alectoria fallacina]